MENWNWVTVALLLAIFWFAPKLGDLCFRPIESLFARIATRRNVTLWLVFFAPIFLRLALLTVIPVPVPGIHDEFSYLLQADTFAHGRLANPPHPLWLNFETMHINWFPTYSSLFPLAQSAVLAIGQVLGHPWIGVLLSVGAMAAAIVWMLQVWMPPRWAFLGGVIAILKLGVISYWIDSYWGGAVAAAGGALVLGGVARIFRAPRLRDALLVGLGVAVLANSRPLEGLIFCVPAAGAVLLWLVKSPRAPLQVKIQRVVIPLAIIIVSAGAFIGYYNWRLTGNALMMPHVWHYRQYMSSGIFFWDKTGPPLHYRNPQLETYWSSWNHSSPGGTWQYFKHATAEKLPSYTQTFFWTGAFPLLFFLPWVFRDRRMRLLSVTFLLSGLGILVVVWALPHYGAPLVCVFYALLIQSLRHLRTVRFLGRPVGIDASRVIFILLLVTLGAGIKTRIVEPHQWGWNSAMGLWDRAIAADTLKQMPGRHLVLIRYGKTHNVNEEWVYNEADIDHAKIVWARDMGKEQNQKLFSYFHDRTLWLVQPEDAPRELKPLSASSFLAAEQP